MMQKRDSGLSIAVGFVMILLVIAMIIGMWAVVGVPEQIRDAEEYHAVKVTNAFLDYKIAVDSQRSGGFTGSKVSMLIPAASAYADGVLVMKEDVGTLSVKTDDESVLYSQNINRLYATFGTTNTLVGYEGGGVFRNDYGYAAWVTLPSITLENTGDLYVTLIVPDMQGSFAVGSSEGIPVDTGLLSSGIPGVVVSLPINEPITITYISDTPDEGRYAKMWSTFFNETAIRYQNIVEDIDVELFDHTASMRISPMLGESLNLITITPEYVVDVRRY